MTRSEPEAESYLARGFRDVDAAAEGKMERCLQHLDSLPDFQRYKALILELMNTRAGSVTADLGCGLGFDVRRLAQLVGAKGKAIGVDSSSKLLASARSASGDYPNAEFIQADIRELPFAGGLLNSCKVDRVLQHVERPEAVLTEIFRTLSAGGRVVCAEPDWGTFSIDGGDSTIPAQIARSWMESFQNPRIGHELKGLLKKTGFIRVQVKERMLSTTGFESSDAVFDIAQSAIRLAAIAQTKDPREWLMRAIDGRDSIHCSVTLVINFAQKPGID
jgi:ubiquinone/menaquinone biosynthesis C-methylase UbiE